MMKLSTLRHGFLTLLLLLLSICPLLAQQVTKEGALAKANKFMSQLTVAANNRAPRTAPELALASTNTEFYVFNDKTNGGYVVVSGEVRMPDVLMYSYSGSYDEANVPCNMRAMLESYAKRVQFLQQHPEAQTAKRSARATKANIANLLGNCWYNQGDPYNRQCPSSGGRCLTGCVATAMAQIMYKYKWPEKTTQRIPEYTTEKLKIYVPSIPETTIDWANMLPAYNYGDSYIPTQANAVANLMKLCGSSVQMDYGPDASAASTWLAGESMKKYFGYDDMLEELYSGNFTTEAWDQLIYDELAAGRPVLYSGQSGNSGHAFVLDGYKDGYFHVNWGWGGAEAYVTMDGKGDWQGFTQDQFAEVNIRPDDGTQATRYAVIDGTTMTLYFDNQKSKRSGTVLPHKEDWQEYKATLTKCVIDPSFANLKLRTLDWFFSEMGKLETIEGMENLNTDGVASMYAMFNECSSLKSIDLSALKTDNVTNMSYAFTGCSSLTSLDLSGFKTDKVSNMCGMFMRCSSLTSLDVSGFNTANVTDMSSMFGGCSSLTSLDVSKFNTDKVTNMGWMFGECEALTSLDVSGFNTANVTDMSSMFGGCSSLTSLDVSKFNTDKVTNMGWMFGGCEALTSLDVSGFNTANVTDMYCMFYNCQNLSSIDVSKFKTAKVTKMNSMFYNCAKLSTLDVSGFNTEEVTDMSWMFGSCESLTNLDVSGFKTDKVTNMSAMFAGCEKLTSLDVSNFNTANVNNMRSMFSNCAELGNVDVRGFKTDNVTDMTWMFAHCKKMTEIDLNSFKTSNVTDMSYMFYASDAVKTIYVSDRWDMTYVTASDEMFGFCEKLVGGAGTAYEYGKMDGTYAHVDEGTTNPGYFTLKSPDVFTLTYLLDGEVYKEMKVTVGTAITPETVPDKEGYTFSGWGDVPATMPAEDLVLQGTYNINSYMITYRIDGAPYKTEMVKYGDPIVPPAVTEKAGYTFEWLDVPATMPAKNIEIIGQYTTGIGTIQADTEQAEWYTIEGRRISAPRKGLNIMRKADGTVKKVMVK